MLYVKGRVELLNAPALAIVGSRNATPQGESNAEAFAAALANAGLTIVSGLALGIDAAAHRGGLRGVGSTIAVIGTGIDRVYPARNQALARDIAASGAIAMRLSQMTGWVSMALMGVWGNIGTGMVIFLAGLQSISPSYYEAAEVDGANGWQRLTRITLPLITPSLFFYFIITMIDAFQVFESIYIMTRGGPVNSTTTLVYYIYRNAFRNFEMGYASAQAIVLFLIIMVLTLIYWRSQERWVVYDA